MTEQRNSKLRKRDLHRERRISLKRISVDREGKNDQLTEILDKEQHLNQNMSLQMILHGRWFHDFIDSWEHASCSFSQPNFPQNE